MTLIGIKKDLLSAISESEEVNILNVSWIAPKVKTVNIIANTLNLFIELKNILILSGKISSSRNKQAK